MMHRDDDGLMNHPAGGNEMTADGNMVRIAAGQYHPVARDVAANVRRTLGLLDEAAGRGADWLVLPELFLSGYQLEQVGAVALDAGSRSIEQIVTHAGRLGIGVQVGFAESSDSVVYDSVLTVPASGERTIYRKTHLFGREPEAYGRGMELPVVVAGETVVAPLICYDLEFPEPARLAAGRGAQIILVSTANMLPYDEQQVLYGRARALENRAFVAVANRVGEESGYDFCGTSLVTDPFGRVIVQANDHDEVMLIADCDLTLIAEARGHGDYLADRRTDLCPVVVPDRVAGGPA